MQLLGMKDLSKRWNYTRQGVHQKQKQDEEFPKPIAKINDGKTQVFLLKDIIEYETKRKELLDVEYKKFHQIKYCYYNKDF